MANQDLNKTVPAPATTKQERSQSACMAARFGTIGFDVYVALVLAESDRLFRAREVL